MKKNCHTLFLFLSVLISIGTSAQVVLNEVTSSNVQLYQDEFSDYPDWIELLNTGTNSVNMAGWGLTDNSTWNKWLLPDINLAGGERLIVFASGNDLNGYVPNTNPEANHWETAINDNNSWQYFIGTASPPANWNTDVSNATGWASGNGGFGYGDGDDVTTVPSGTISTYFRKTFTATNEADLVEAVFSMDYDDAFIAYLNGVEIARNGLSGVPQFDTFSEIDHEAAMYQGGDPEQFYVDYSTLQSMLTNGINLLAIEIHNVGTTSSDLTGRAWLHLGIESTATYYGANPTWFIPPVGGGNGQNLHTNFKIGFNETVRLFDSLGIEQDNVLMDAQAGHARARIPDAGLWCYTDLPTPNTANVGTCYSGYATPPTVNPAAGFYTTNFSCSMTAAVGTTVRYTQNGDAPSATSTLYVNPFTVNTTRVVRARAFQANKLPSEVVTRSYFKSDPTQLPVVSIAAHSGDLFNDGTGGPAVYDNAQAFQQASTTGCTIQYFNAAHQLQFESAASFTPVGNYSIAFAQKSLQFKFDEDYGATGEVLYNIFSLDKPELGSSHGFRVRNTDDDYGNGGGGTGARMRDLVANRMALPTYSATAGYQNVSVYINGTYWGHYGGREMLNKYFMRDNFGCDIDNVNMVKTAFPLSDPYTPEEGTADTFYLMSDFIIDNDMTVQTNFDLATSLIDSENWVDYWADQIYNNNQDWYASCYFNNTRLAASELDNVKWKYILWDVGYSQGNAGNAWDDLLSNALAFPCYSNRHTDMIASLLNNDGFRNYFINRFADLLNWHWTTPKVHAIIDACAAEIDQEITRQNNTWGSGSLSYWQGQVQNLKNFHTDRTFYQRQHIEDYFEMSGQVDVTLQVSPAGAGVVKISTIIPDTYPWTGVYFNGNPVKVTAIANPGYTFVNWNSNAFISNLNAASFTNNINTNTTFTANFTGSPIAANVIVTEINYNSDSTMAAGDWIEIYNNTSVALDISDWQLQDGNFWNRFTIPTGTSLGSHQYLVLVDDMEQFSVEHPSVSNVIGEFDFDLSNGGESITLYNRLEQVVTTFAYDDNSAWPCTPDGHGRTLELTSFASLPTLASSWFEGCMGGSPGQAFTACNENPLVDEINYKSATATNAGDWIEMYNKTGSTIDLSNWNITDNNGNGYIIPLGTVLPALSYLVFYQDAVLFTSQFPTVLNKVGPTGFGLNGDGDVIRISDASGRLFQSICYNDTAPWPLTADGDGYTLELLDQNGNLNSGINWFAGCPGGSPGQAFDADCTPCEVFGCNDPAACNFVSAEVCDDGSCIHPGCTSAQACNFNAAAGCDDGTCTFPGCIDLTACNFDSDAGCDDGSCTYITYYFDGDNDGFGNPSVSLQQCSTPADYVTDNTDCNDSDSTMYPGAVGTAQGVDNNCNGTIDITEDSDCVGDFNGDGFINSSDLLLLMAGFGCTASCTVDLTGDEVVNTSDLLLFMAVFGTICP